LPDVAEIAYLSGFLRSGLLAVSACSVLSGVKVVSILASRTGTTPPIRWPVGLEVGYAASARQVAAAKVPQIDTLIALLT
jgi:hypothetical protein